MINKTFITAFASESNLLSISEKTKSLFYRTVFLIPLFFKEFIINR